MPSVPSVFFPLNISNVFWTNKFLIWNDQSQKKKKAFMKAYKRVSNNPNWAAKGNVLTAPGFHISCLVVQALVMLSHLSSCPMQSCPCFPKANPTVFIKSWSLTTKFIVGESWDVNILRVIRNRQPLWHFQVGCKSRGVIGPIGNPQLHLRKHEYSWRGGGIY